MATPSTNALGLTVIRIHDNFIYWCAWREWLAKEAGKTFFPDSLTLPGGAWPPTGIDTAAIFAQKFNEARRKAGYQILMDDQPEPWDKWSTNQILDYERRHREDYAWLPPLPKHRVKPTVIAFKSQAQHEVDDWMGRKVAHSLATESTADILRRMKNPPRRGVPIERQQSFTIGDLRPATPGVPAVIRDLEADAQAKPTIPFRPSDPEIVRKQRELVERFMEQPDALL